MIARPRPVVLLVGTAAAIAAVAAVVARHARGAMGRKVPGGILIRDAGRYDALSHRLLLGGFLERVAADIAAAAPHPARVLEVGCGPGRLSILLARRYGLAVTGLDLDPAMIERARANAAHTAHPHTADKHGHQPWFVVGDVAALAFLDQSFDVVVSTLSLHHWADPAAGLAEIGRVLRPDGRALIWDFRAGRLPLHGRMPDPTEHARGSPLRVVSARPWRWPWRVTLTTRLELVRDGESVDLARE